MKGCVFICRFGYLFVGLSEFCGTLKIIFQLFLHLLPGNCQRKLFCFSFQLSTTNFKDDVSLASLLVYINSTFEELKHHEEIEDSCILTQLQHRLINKQILTVVNDVHKDNRVLEILSLTRKGLKSTSKSRPRWNRHTFEDRLKEALQSFQKDFLPHMRHEEEVFNVSFYFLYANQCH